MSTTSKYYETKFEIERLEFHIQFLKEDDEAAHELLKTDRQLKSEMAILQEIEVQLKENNEQADEVRIGMIALTNKLIEYFDLYHKYDFLYPDLNQSMIVPGFLIGKILHAYRDLVINEGAQSSISIFPSKNQWDYSSLEKLIREIRSDLQNMQFLHFFEAINYYTSIANRIRVITEELRAKNII